MPKRRNDDAVGGVEASTPRKSRRILGDKTALEPASTPTSTAETPSQRKSILRGTPSKTTGVNGDEETPKALRRVLFSTPTQNDSNDVTSTEDAEDVDANRNDLSARRKSARALQKHDEDDGSDIEADAQETALAREILDEDASGSELEEDIAIPQPDAAAATPSKRGRPKGKRRERTPSPPPDLPPYELYFFQNRTGASKTSSNTLRARLLQNHEDYLANTQAYKDPHELDIDRLKQYHRRGYDQWMYELEEGFNICLYGYGSKRELALDFAEYMYAQGEKPPKIVVVNGCSPGLTIRDILTTLATIILPKTAKLPAQPQPLLDLIIATLFAKPPQQPVTLLINSFDHLNLRKPATQALLAQLAAHPSIHLIASCDTPNFPLLWDTTLLRQFRWLYHDATTFQPYTSEIDVVDDVNTLLGRSGRRLGGKDGVGYVLKSLPENARNLFRILVAEQLASSDTDPSAVAGAALGHNDDADSIFGASDEEEAAQQQNTPSRRGRKSKSKSKANGIAHSTPAAVQAGGVEYRTLYHKAVEEFVCSSELNFRTLLKEFHDHQMVESRRDAAGTEKLSVPFRREELEAILEELI